MWSFISVVVHFEYSNKLREKCPYTTRISAINDYVYENKISFK